MISLTELEALAKAATPGPWRHDKQEESLRPWDAKVVSDGGDICTTHKHTGEKAAMYWEVTHPDAAFIAEANPETILTLVSLVREMGEALEMSWADIYVDGVKTKQMAEQALTKYKEVCGE